MLHMALHVIQGSIVAARHSQPRANVSQTHGVILQKKLFLAHQIYTASSIAIRYVALWGQGLEHRKIFGGLVGFRT